MFHAEQMKKIGAGLLSESNHGLKKDIEEVSVALDKIEKGIVEADEETKDLVRAMLEDGTVQRMVNFMVAQIERKYPDMEAGEVVDLVQDLLSFMYAKRGSSMSTFAYKGSKRGAATLGRQIKRDL